MMGNSPKVIDIVIRAAIGLVLAVSVTFAAVMPAHALDKAGNKKAAASPKADGASANDDLERAVHSAITDHLVIPAGLENDKSLKVVARFHLKPDGSVDGEPVVEVTGGSSGAKDRMKRAVLWTIRKAQPFKLPAEKYEVWKELIMHIQLDEEIK